jgi:uncharacterized protein YsxB (DUF464 family)
MISIHYTVSGDAFELTMMGHAGYAQAGEDIVCAGASTLLFTLLNHLEVMGEDYRAEYNKGYATICADSRPASDAFEVIMTGFRMLATKYPERVRVICDAPGG